MMSKLKLAFRQEGTFKIVQFTDIHLKDGQDADKDTRTLAGMTRIVERELPDLIVFSGDLVDSLVTRDVETTLRRVIQIAVDAAVPFAVVYGNHDSEREGVIRSGLQEIVDSYELSVSEAGPEDIGGTGNYAVGIHGSTGGENAAVLYFLDSGDYAPEKIGGYAWVQTDQVGWYARKSKEIEKRIGAPIPALMFLHIPLPEYNEAWQFGRVSGNKGEEVCSPKLNSGLYVAMLERGDVMGVFAGHDHDNDYSGVLHGITLAYGRVTGHNTYGELTRGARIILLSEGERIFDTWIRLEDGVRI
jgi:hypothetical protein